jgi:hypothetical protein
MGLALVDVAWKTFFQQIQPWATQYEALSSAAEDITAALKKLDGLLRELVQQ